ncbi:precorrin-8X methylmutase [Clostridium fallax]|uniref:Precorrin-8X methylmutase n=1 Tax=Clostridium fallax TaxID=1533 RepID=A0A1M4Y235_9CLOT|nr:precorrin-8X methylmutase [Clostridium fallax]SHE99897.1 precorrin-8X methylmutase [Clostridium fallax]SQB07786.1 precorrin-8X methylmutase CbiC/CobH [Clostridium fallax]
MSYNKNPMGIEKRSFEIIGEEMGPHNFSERELQIVKRTIHTTADFQYKDLITISPKAIDEALELLKNGCKIYTDTQMIKAGINKKALEKLGCEIVNYVSTEKAYEIAKEKGITRSMAAIEMAIDEGIEFFVFGNAPTALYRLLELYDKGAIKPKFVIGAPVGFVGASESKEELLKYDIENITIRGRKGGSTVAASIVNALLYMVVDR